MPAIKAFVGHSFRDEDAAVVTVILQCLTRVSQIHTSFSWGHAQEPEPEMVHSKVLTMLADKNLFIGICTASEQVVSSKNLKPIPIWRNRLFGQASAFELKASDWILQEIGLSVGRGLKVILLLEEGVRTPGVLQGNLEYIRFSRSAPERACDKLLGMLASLLAQPKEDVPDAGQEAQPPYSGETSPLTTTTGRDWNTPQSDWPIKDFRFGYMHAIAISDEPLANKVRTTFLASPLGTTELARTDFSAWMECSRIRFGKDGSLAKLEGIANQHKAIGAIWGYLAATYVDFDEHLKAATAFSAAAEGTDAIERKIEFLGKSALAYEKVGLHTESLKKEMEMRDVGRRSEQGAAAVLIWTIDIAEVRNDGETQIAAMERLLELTPDDHERRFKLAYRYSQTERPELSTYHYLRIPVANRGGTEWDNLGVAFDGLSMPIRSVAAYRESRALGETLAMSNLSGKFLEAGFIDEAKALLVSAIEFTDHHRNVDKNMVRVKDAVDEENKKEEAAIKKAKPLSDFYRQLGKSLALPQALDLSGQWKSPDCMLTVSVNGDALSATGTFELANNGLLSLAIADSPFGFGTIRPPRRFVVNYKGKVRGRCVMGTITRLNEAENRPNAANSLLGGVEKQTTILMWLAEDGLTLHALESSAVASKFHSLQRITTLTNTL